MSGERTEQPVSAAAPGRAAAGGRTPADRAPGGRTARGRILAAAERLFAERGFDHTPTALIAAEARVPQGLIFYHFKTKMELLLAVIREDQAALLDGLLPDGARGAQDEGLHQAVAALWRHLSGVLGQPSPVRKIIIQELAATRRSASAPWNCMSRWPRSSPATSPGPPGTPVTRCPGMRPPPGCSRSRPGWLPCSASPASRWSRPPLSPA